MDTPITSADLLQANVTIIAGILVLLTVSIISKKENSLALFFMKFSPALFIVSIGCLFLPITGYYLPEDVYVAAVLAFMGGLGYLLGAIISIVRSIGKNAK